MIEQLRLHPLWLLFLVVTIGCSLERIPFIRRTLGTSAVLFVGLIAGTLDPELRIPIELCDFGLVLFVYTVGLSCGPVFVRTFRSSFPKNCLVASMIILVALVVFVTARFLAIPPATAAGFFTGCLTNTPALASLTEKLANQGVDDSILAQPIVGYSIAYPISILSVIMAIQLVTRFLKTDYSSEAKRLIALGAAGETILNVTVRVTRQDLTNIPIRILFAGNAWRALLGRRLRGTDESLVQRDTCLAKDDLVSVIGTEEDVRPVIEFLGVVEPDLVLGMDRGHYDNRRIFLSNSKLFGRRIGELNLPKDYEAIITRLRRGDHDFLATADLVLEPGDRVRVVAPKSKMKAISDYLGDSYKALSEIDFFSFSLGLLIGFFVGQIPLPAPAGYDLQLGLAGGPLIVALFLGWAGRTGSLVWTLPYSANMTLRQIGMVMFLAGVGTRAGYAFFSTLMAGGWLLMIVTAAIVLVVTIAALMIGHRGLGVPMSVMIGVVAGMQTQPALLSYATQQTGNDSPNIGYASVYPIAMIFKILVAQWVLIALSS